MLTEQVEQLCKCLEQMGAGGDGEGAVYSSRSSFTEAMMNKPNTFVEAAQRANYPLKTSNPSRKQEFENLNKIITGRDKPRPKQSIIGLVYESIKRSRKGVAFVEIQKKTGFNRLQIANALYKLKKKGIIVNLKHGVYARK